MRKFLILTIIITFILVVILGYIYLSLKIPSVPISSNNSDNPSPNSQKPCYIGGCSKEICSEQENAVSACIYLPQFACYKNARCERQPNGQCDWTQTEELESCLNFKIENSLEYKNDQYGFKIALLDSWKGYSVVSGGWKGDIILPKWASSS